MSSSKGQEPRPRETAVQQEQRVERDLDALLAETARERDEYLELAKRTKADFENYRKRVAGEARQAEARGRAALAREILTVADNLERALENMTPDPQADRAVDDRMSELASGVRLVRDELQSALGRAGVESYEPLGEPFDPEWHEAVLTQPVPDDDDGKVMDVLTKGYRLDGQVLRPARVTVGKNQADRPQADDRV